MDKVKKLDAIGFVWEAQRGRRKLPDDSTPENAGTSKRAVPYESKPAEIIPTASANETELRSAVPAIQRSIGSAAVGSQPHQNMTQRQELLNQKLSANPQSTQGLPGVENSFSQIQALLFGQGNSTGNHHAAANLTSNQQRAFAQIPPAQSQGAAGPSINEMLSLIAGQNSRNRSFAASQPQPSDIMDLLSHPSIGSDQALARQLAASLSGQGQRAQNIGGIHTFARPPSASDELLAHLQAREISSRSNRYLSDQTHFGRGTEFFPNTHASQLTQPDILDMLRNTFASAAPASARRFIPQQHQGMELARNILSDMMREDNTILDLLAGNAQQQFPTANPPHQSSLQQLSQQGLVSDLFARGAQRSTGPLGTDEASPAAAATSLERLLQSQHGANQDQNPQHSKEGDAVDWEDRKPPAKKHRKGGPK
jgi:hypothetical protein